MITTTTPKLLTNAQAAEVIGIRPNTLEIWRCKGKGPKFIKLEPNEPRSPIRYWDSEILGWLAARTCTSTSAYHMTVQP